MIQNLSSTFLKRQNICLQKYFYNTTGTTYANHYETLKLERNCTSKDIRDSFLKLSKENHPDLNKNPKAHNEFLKIQDAYDILSKPELRASYDLSLSHLGYKTFHGTTVHTTKARYGQKSWNPWDDPAFYHNRDKSEDKYYEGRPYYGINGIPKMSNGTIAMYCVLLAAVAFVAQMACIKYSYTLRRDFMIQKSNHLEETLSDVKDRASQNGNKMQIEILRQKFEEQERKKLNYNNIQ